MTPIRPEREPTYPITRKQVLTSSFVIGLIYLVGTKNIQKFACAFLAKAKTYTISYIEFSGPFTLQAICFAFFRYISRNQRIN